MQDIFIVAIIISVLFFLSHLFHYYILKSIEARLTKNMMKAIEKLEWNENGGIDDE